MRIAIFVGHPAQFHLFKFVAKNLREAGHEVEFLVKRKDMLEDLVQKSGFDYTVVRKQERKSSTTLNLIWEMLKLDFNVSKYIISKKPDIVIGTYCPVFSRVLPVKFIVCNEDDANVVPRFAKLAYPAASAILTPITCDCGKWNAKAIKYAGYQKLAYLHPNQFTPDINVVERYLGKDFKPYVLMRFAKLNAHHDGDITGISDEMAQKIVKDLKATHAVYISSERPLTPELEPYRLKIDTVDMHHLMAFADLYLGDSQSMAVESAILGIPNIRYNNFVAKIGVLNELENKYKLTFGIKSGSTQQLFDKIHEIISTPETKTEFKQRRNQLLGDKIDVTAFITWFVDNYPSSSAIMKENPNYQNNFK